MHIKLIKTSTNSDPKAPVYVAMNLRQIQSVCELLGTQDTIWSREQIKSLGARAARGEFDMYDSGVEVTITFKEGKHAIPGYRFREDLEVGGVTNGQRAAWAIEALRTFAERTGMIGEDLPTITGDLMCDIMHLAGACGFNPEEFMIEVTANAVGNWEDESDLGEHEGEGEPVAALLFDPGKDGADIFDEFEDEDDATLPAIKVKCEAPTNVKKLPDSKRVACLPVTRVERTGPNAFTAVTSFWPDASVTTTCCDQEKLERMAADHKKQLSYDKHAGTWSWFDRADVDNVNAYHSGFKTRMAALEDALEPYLEEDES